MKNGATHVKVIYYYHGNLTGAYSEVSKNYFVEMEDVFIGEFTLVGDTDWLDVYLDYYSFIIWDYYILE